MISENKELTIVKQPHKIVVSLWLDNYDNIFSDFDPRSYQHRLLSDDFLSEARKVSQENASGVFDITLLVPAGLRDLQSEKIIKERLHSYFRTQALKQEKTHKSTVRKGSVLTLLGLVAMMAATTVSTLFLEDNVLMHLLRVILEPGGWFMTWFGLDLIFYSSSENRTDLIFNRKMSRAAIEFDTYSASR